MLNKNKKLSKVNKRSNQRNNQRNNKRSNNKRSNSNKTKKYQKYITKGGGKNLCDLLKKTTQFTSKKSTTFANSFTTNEEFPDFENTNSNTELIYTGINNVGSSCYINATLQMLWSIPELRILFETSTVEDIKKIKYSEKYFIVDQNDKGVKIDYRENKLLEICQRLAIEGIQIKSENLPLGDMIIYDEISWEKGEEAAGHIQPLPEGSS